MSFGEGVSSIPRRGTHVKPLHGNSRRLLSEAHDLTEVLV